MQERLRLIHTEDLTNMYSILFVSLVVVVVLKAQEDVAGGQKREEEVEEEGEDPYNEENIEQVGSDGN